MAQQDLDEKMQEILKDRGLNPYEKIKKFNDLLQRYLSFTRQGENEVQPTTRSLP